MLLLGETGYHRLRSTPYDKRLMLRTSSRQAIAALTLLAVALPAVVYLVTSVLYGSGPAIAFTLSLGLLAVVTWFLLPLQRRWSDSRSRG